LKSRKHGFPAICLASLAAGSAAAVWFFYAHGWLLYFGDAEAHLNTARRIVDSQTPGYEQLGRIWLPLPHLLMLPLVRIDTLWRNGLAGAIPSALCFVVAGTFLYAAARRLFDSTAAAAASTALFAANPNLLYLQATAMGEPVFFACLMALLYASGMARRRRGGAGLRAGNAGALRGMVSDSFCGGLLFADRRQASLCDGPGIRFAGGARSTAMAGAQLVADGRRAGFLSRSRLVVGDSA
jgi:hypothetical protein